MRHRHWLDGNFRGKVAGEMKPHERIIVALDVDSLDKALPLVESLSPHVGCFKVGLELLTSAGAPEVVAAIHERGGKVFFDGKFDDIPNTVAGAAKAAAALGVHMFDVHACCGIEGMKAAAANKGKSLLLAVTVLTSFDEEGSRRVFGASSSEKVKQFVEDAAKAGVDGVVCSPKELEMLSRLSAAERLLKVTPGVRPAWAAANDQKRTLTPKEAIQRGASYLVIGRPILQPPSVMGTPQAAAKEIAREIAEGLQ